MQLVGEADKDVAGICGLPQGIILRNGGSRCDLLFGPCSCGAWHKIKDMYNDNYCQVIRLYLYYLNHSGELK